MIIFPAIDLRGGKCVRLIQGDFDRETIYSDDPQATALRWQSLGAKFLHVVDLDGARAGSPQNLSAIKKILDAIKIPIEVGGGIRTLDDIEKILLLGVRRVILGSVAVENISLVREAVKKFGDKIVVGIDARDGFVAVHGWEKSSKVRAGELAKKIVAAGVETIIYTDISKDGMLSGVDAEVFAKLAEESGAQIVASGGVSSLEDIRALKAAGVGGVIVGKAIYTGALDLRAALEIAESYIAPNDEKPLSKVNLEEKFKLFSDYWRPKIIGELNDSYVKVAKFKGEFTWHKHSQEDELIFVVKGSLEIQFRDKNVALNQGEFLIIPKGVEHCPRSEEEADIMLLEPKSTLNTGDIVNEKTVKQLQRI